MAKEETKEQRNKRVAGWLFVGIYPQYIQANGRSVPTAVQAMKDARKAVDELDEANELELLEMALESSKMFAK